MSTGPSASRPWLGAYPAQVPADIDPSQYHSLVGLLEEALQRHRTKTAYSSMGQDMRFDELQTHSASLGAYLQGLGLQRGDRVALMMPNVLQYPIATAAVLRAGLVVVNVNPLYTARELEHQLKDCGARAIVIIDSAVATLRACMDATNIEHVVVTALGDRLGLLRGMLVNYRARRGERGSRASALPATLRSCVRFNAALRVGSGRQLCTPAMGGDDVAVLQYTGGTTGVSKAAVLLHRNIVANVLQSEAWNRPAMSRVEPHQQPTGVCALPLYHIFAFTVSMMLSLRTGGKVILIPNPRDVPAVLKELRKHTFHFLPGVNTLFNALANHALFDSVDWSHLKLSKGGGTAIQAGTARLWLEKTGCAISEGYGLSETSPSVCSNPSDGIERSATIGVPLPSTWVKCIDEAGNEVAIGQSGEIAIKGPQVMAGYWGRPDETARVMTADGYFRSGDVGVMDARGFFRIVDRKKDMILVSGFNVYPNEIEDVVSELPGVLEVAAIGVPDARTAEAVKLVVVRKDPQLGEQEIREHCRAQLSAYKQPRAIEFRAELPKSAVGKVLRRQLREESARAG